MPNAPLETYRDAPPSGNEPHAELGAFCRPERRSSFVDPRYWQGACAIYLSEQRLISAVEPDVIDPMSSLLLRRVPSALALASLAACISPEELRREDEAACVSFGFQPGTSDFAACLQRESLARRYQLTPQYPMWGPPWSPYWWR